jgi:uncharacterized membrane protein
MNEVSAVQSPSRHKLNRLEILMDSVFAIVIVVLAGSLPLPNDVDWSGGSLWEFLLEQTNDISFAVIGMVLVVIYWIQNNLLFENLTHTDNKHAVISLVQVFFLLLYFYAVSLGIDFEDDPSALVIQSIAAALVGFAAVAGWWYAAAGRRLLSDGLSDAAVGQIKINILAEPITALITLPFATYGPNVWGAAWLVYPLVSYFLKKKMFGGK